LFIKSWPTALSGAIAALLIGIGLEAAPSAPRKWFMHLRPSGPFSRSSRWSSSPPLVLRRA